MNIELIERSGRYEYEDLKDGDIFSLYRDADTRKFYIMYTDDRGYLAAISLDTGEKLLMNGNATVTVYDKKFMF